RPRPALLRRPVGPEHASARVQQGRGRRHRRGRATTRRGGGRGASGRTVSGPDAGSYFGADPGLRPAGEGAYVALDALDVVEFVPGLEFRPLVGERMMVNFAHYAPNTEAPSHTHAEEQVTFVIDGEFEFDLDGDVRTMRR